MAVAIDIEKLERMAKLRLGEGERVEAERLASLMAEGFSLMSLVPTDGVEPFIYVTDEVNVFREDRAEQPIDRETLLEAAPEQEGGHVKVPRTID